MRIAAATMGGVREPPDRTLPQNLELIDREPDGAPERGVEALAFLQTNEQRLEIPTAGTSSQFDHGSCRQRVGRLGGDRRSPEPAVENVEIRDPAPEYRQVHIQVLETTKLPRRPGGVALVEPEWEPRVDRVVEGKMGQLVS